MNKSNLAVAQSGNPNIGLIQSLYAMFERGDIASIVASTTPDVICRHAAHAVAEQQHVAVGHGRPRLDVEDRHVADQERGRRVLRPPHQLRRPRAGREEDEDGAGDEAAQDQYPSSRAIRSRCQAASPQVSCAARARFKKKPMSCSSVMPMPPCICTPS